MKKTSLLAAPLALAFSIGLAAVATPALAGPTEDAKTLFDAGARAYKLGDFKAAIQAFEQSYKVEERLGVLFSIAQAHRRQYALDHKPARVAEALRRYREYVKKVEQGGRRADAVAAIAELEPIAQKLEQEGSLKPGARLDEETGTRLMVSGPVDSATLFLDGDDKPRPIAFVIELKPGKHSIRVHADGYADERRDIDVVAGTVTALDLPLRELPVRLSLTGPAGADVSIDGRFVGATPFPTPVDVTPGKHHIRFVKGGYQEYSTDVSLSRGGEATIDAQMARTRQRTLAYALGLGGAASSIVGISLAAVAAGKQSTATGIKSDLDHGRVTCPSSCAKISDYNDAVSARDGLRAGAGVMLGLGVAALGAGIGLYFFDGRASLRGRDEAAPPAPAPAPARPAPVEVSAAPTIVPGFYGASLSARF